MKQAIRGLFDGFKKNTSIGWPPRRASVSAKGFSDHTENMVELLPSTELHGGL